MPLWPKVWIPLWIIPFKSSIILPSSKVAFTTTLFWIINIWVAFDQTWDMYGDAFRPSESACSNMNNFDYIVIGSGAAGMVVATRVANYSRKNSVLLLEAGGEVRWVWCFKSTIFYYERSTKSIKFKCLTHTAFLFQRFTSSTISHVETSFKHLVIQYDQAGTVLSGLWQRRKKNNTFFKNFILLHFAFSCNYLHRGQSQRGVNF